MSAVTDQTIAARIDAVCEARKLTTTAFARLMGCGTKKARSLRTGTGAQILITDVIAAARVLDVPLEAFVKEMA